MLYYNEKKQNKKHVIRILILLIMIFLSIINPKTNNYLTGIFGLITKPFTVLTSVVTNGINDVIDFTFGSKPNRDMVNKLKAENEELKKQVNDLTFVVDNKEYLKQNYDFMRNANLMNAKVIMQDNDIFFSNFKINKGSLNGIKVGDIIVNAYNDSNSKGALTGVVTSVGLNSSDVSSILNSKYNITFVDSKSDITGVIDERYDGYLYGYLLEKKNIKVGEKIYTSGTGGRYPRGVYIGDVVEVKESVDRLKKIVKIKSPINFSKMYNVYVLPIKE
ncbi:rod shape-determining protein MreC [Helcococcus ovis]|uniref:Cell shape-determining protein MreC n=1 Tax=Helcococcus ovis TaxID=72026 RepID=A0A4R9C0P9_9FIRM|nr:rod shape-determining protein MreC [Helcococcus ovis]TFF63889.1 rod shape-determining protein MreC [Helcococcus ovis]TFF64448.1 rod shape-determining protein MreC [Helcococcus ovis]